MSHEAIRTQAGCAPGVDVDLRGIRNSLRLRATTGALVDSKYPGRCFESRAGTISRELALRLGAWDYRSRAGHQRSHQTPLDADLPSPNPASRSVRRSRSAICCPCSSALRPTGGERPVQIPPPAAGKQARIGARPHGTTEPSTPRQHRVVRPVHPSDETRTSSQRRERVVSRKGRGSSEPPDRRPEYLAIRLLGGVDCAERDTSPRVSSSARHAWTCLEARVGRPTRSSLSVAVSPEDDASDRPGFQRSPIVPGSCLRRSFRPAPSVGRFRG